MMLGYFDVFPEKCETEIRTAHFSADASLPFPHGTYVFAEFYCVDLSCDCQRLLVKALYVKTPQSKPKEVATFSYSWNDAPDDSWANIIGETTNPFLDPLHRQAAYADELMGFWYDMLCRDHEYAERLRKHYAELRRERGQSAPPSIWDEEPAKIVAIDLGEKKRRHRALREHLKKRRSSRRQK
ncbi:MAG: hypothetical protein KDA51_11800 [Planctomycetales bacterium]|nr:hypothetical protein [Planctomycetales bacterium]